MKTERTKRVQAVDPVLEAACLRFAKFRSAIRQGRIDATAARRVFRRHYTRLSEICEREACSMAKARTISATLEGDVNTALIRAGQPGILKTYSSLDDLLKDLQS